MVENYMTIGNEIMQKKLPLFFCFFYFFKKLFWGAIIQIWPDNK